MGKKKIFQQLETNKNKQNNNIFSALREIFHSSWILHATQASSL